MAGFVIGFALGAVITMIVMSVSSESEYDAFGLYETNIFDEEETYHGCTVQVLKNTVTGEISIGWWQE